MCICAHPHSICIFIYNILGRWRVNKSWSTNYWTSAPCANFHMRDLMSKIFRVLKYKYVLSYFFSTAENFFLSFFLSCLYIVVYVRENVKNYVALSEGERERDGKKISTKNVREWGTRWWCEGGLKVILQHLSNEKNEAETMRYRRLYILFLCFSFLLLYFLSLSIKFSNPHHPPFFSFMCCKKYSGTIAAKASAAI